MTRTYTHFFSDDDPRVIVLESALEALTVDWTERTPYMDRDVAKQGTERLEAVRLASARLVDRVAE